MLQLANKELRVDLLDPRADISRLGARFCWGGFIWQVHDLESGPLLSGPEWPTPEPTPFNGQGLPESFRYRSLSGIPYTWDGEKGVSIGAGTIARNASGDVIVTTPCKWTMETPPQALRFSTFHHAHGYSYALVREITLRERTIESVSRLTNKASTPLSLEWFAHPFFPLSDGLVHAKVAPEAILPSNPGFSLEAGSLTQKRRFDGTKDGHMDHLQLPKGKNFEVQIAHPTLSHISFFAGFSPSDCVIWGNSVTFSFEPYQMITLSVGESKEWILRYEFPKRRTE